MLLFNGLRISEALNLKNLNTSYVTVQRNEWEKIFDSFPDLNTSYVTVQLKMENKKVIINNYLNTSYVTVQHIII